MPRQSQVVLTNAPLLPPRIAAQQIDEACWRSALSAEVGSSAMIAGSPDQRARRSHALLLAHRQLRGRASENIAPQIEALGKARKLGCGRSVARPQPRTARRRETAGEQDVVACRQIRQQVEHLKHEADVIRPKTIARAGRQTIERLTAP